MDDKISFQDLMRKTRILRPPKYTLATFGTTTLRYVLLSTPSEMQNACRLREGQVTAQRPKILTPGVLQERFQGFGEDADQYQRHLNQAYGEALRGLEYTFHNDLKSTTVESAPLEEMADRMRKSMDAEDAPRSALLAGPDRHWPLAIMKFIVDTSFRSFPANVQELDERGLFSPERQEETRRRREVERLFQKAQTDSTNIQPLARFLKDNGLFKEYEDRFFALVHHS